MPETLHLEAGVPKYIQISNWLMEMIQKGRYAVHEKLPSESKLSGLFGVNRNTVRQAISDLVAKGLVEKKNGVGSFVIGRSFQPVKYTLQHISSFTDDMMRMGVVPQTKLIHKSVIEAPPDVADKLMQGKKKRVILTERLRLGNRIPLVIERSYLPYEEYKGILKMRLTGSLYHLLTRKFHVVLHLPSNLSRHPFIGEGCEVIGGPCPLTGNFSRKRHLRLQKHTGGGAARFSSGG